MGLFGAIGSGLSKFGQLAGKALRPFASVAQPLAGAVSAAAQTFLPGAAGRIVSGIAQKVGDFVSSGKAADIAGKIAGAGAALTGMALGGPPRGVDG